MIKRDLFEKLKTHLSRKEISLIVGPRQAGKTTLLLLLKDYLLHKGKKTVFLNLDIEADKKYFSSQNELVQKIRLEAGEREAYIFIDEMQRKENAGVFLKGIYDMNLPYKLIVSGSGSLELKEKIHESLAGRKAVFELGTLTFSEFVSYKTEYKYEGKLHDFFTVEPVEGRALFEEYLNFGGYPRVVLAKTLTDKQQVIDDIYRSYVDRDISILLGVKKSDEFSNLVRILASQIGQLVNHTEISSTLGIAAPTLKEYLWYLEKTFIVHKVSPYFRNVRKEITKNPVFYFSDPGLRNYSLGIFGSPVSLNDKGYIYQNFVFNSLHDNLNGTSAKVHFWRTKGRAEVDFVIDKGLALIPVEVKYKELKDKTITRSFQSFIADYKPQKGYVVNLALNDSTIVNRTLVNFIPYFELVSPNWTEELAKS